MDKMVERSFMPETLIMRARKESKEILDSKSDNTFINIEKKDMELMKCEKCNIEEDCGIYLIRQQDTKGRRNGSTTCSIRQKEKSKERVEED